MERKKYRILMGNLLVKCALRKREVNIRSKINFLEMQACLAVMLYDGIQRVLGPHVSWDIHYLN
jgi:hypothetical protein